MAMGHFLKMFPMPENPGCYLGFFENYGKRVWSDRPNKTVHGVSYTKFGDVMDLEIPGTDPFYMFHGRCYQFAHYFAGETTGWTVTIIERGNFWNTIVHAFCTKEINGKTYFADARGITDDPSVFFEDYDCSRNAYLVTEKQKDTDMEFRESVEIMYDYIMDTCIAQGGHEICAELAKARKTYYRYEARHSDDEEWKGIFSVMNPDERREAGRWLKEPEWYKSNPGVRSEAWFTEYGYEKYRGNMNRIISKIRDRSWSHDGTDALQLRIREKHRLRNQVVKGKVQCVCIL